MGRRAERSAFSGFMRWVAPILALATAVVFVLSAMTLTGGSDQSTSNRANESTTDTGRAIEALTGPHPEAAMGLVPPGFAQSMSYQPVLINGVPANPRGGCSSPIPMPTSFDSACKTHDFGYDLLRYANRTGHPLGMWARRDLDTQLVERMRSTCQDESCWGAVDMASTGVTVNSRRQDEGVPQKESVGQIVTTTATLMWEPLVAAPARAGWTASRIALAGLVFTLLLSPTQVATRRFISRTHAIQTFISRRWRHNLQPHR